MIKKLSKLLILLLLIPSLSLTLLIWLYLNNKLRTLYLTVILLIILFFPILSLLNLYLENENIINSIANLGIIWGYEDKNNYLDYKIPAVVNNDLLSLLLFLKNNILTFVIGFFKKIWFFNFRIRPYYSDFYNFYIIAFNLVYWPAAVIGLLKLQNRNNLGIIFQAQRKFKDAAINYSKALNLDQNIENLLGNNFYNNQFICNWSHFDEELIKIKEGIIAKKSLIDPFIFLSISDDFLLLFPDLQ